MQLDNRGLSPPEPMLRILDALERLPANEALTAQMDRRPVFLFPELEERGYAYDIAQQPEGWFLLTIQKR